MAKLAIHIVCMTRKAKHSTTTLCAALTKQNTSFGGYGTMLQLTAFHWTICICHSIALVFIVGCRQRLQLSIVKS